MPQRPNPGSRTRIVQRDKFLPICQNTTQLPDIAQSPQSIEEYRRSLKNNHRPAENILLSTPIGLNYLGAEFNVNAPFSVCRLCGALYQSRYDRLARNWLESGRLVEHFNAISRESYFTGDPTAVGVLDSANDRRNKWRRLHERRYHTDEEIQTFALTGFALTPEAAHRLAPFGITPLGFPGSNMNIAEEIADALFTAPRAPYNDADS